MSHWWTVISAAVVLFCVAPLAAYEVVLARSVVQGDDAVVWLGRTPADAANVSLRLASANDAGVDVVVQKTLSANAGLTAVELEVAPGAAKKSNGRLELSLALPCSTASTCTQPDGWPVRLLEPVHAIGLRTEKSRYRPASVVSIWLSAVDWDGRVAADAALGVRLLGASNATVRSWTVTLAWPGLRRLQLPLGRRAELGRWTVEAGLASADGRLVDAAARCHFDVDDGDSRDGAETMPTPTPPPSPLMAVAPHYVELNFSRRSAVAVRRDASIAAELVVGTSELGITVAVDALDADGRSLHRQTLHLNRTAAASFLVPPLNSSHPFTLQATLLSIEGEPVDNQFVLATHQVAVLDVNDTDCQVLLFASRGNYRFQEGDEVTVLVHSTCRLVRPVAHWAVTHRSGRIVAWGQEYLARYDVASPPSEFQFNLSVSVLDDMIPRSYLTVFVEAGADGRLVAAALPLVVRPVRDVRVRLASGGAAAGAAAGAVRVNVSLTVGSGHCLYGSWLDAEDDADDAEDVAGDDAPVVVERRGPAHLLPADGVATPPVLHLFGRRDLWFVECFEPSEHSWRQLNVAVPRAGVATPYLRLATVDATGRLGLSQPLSLSVVRPAPWSVDFELPASVRVGEEVVVDVHLRNGQSNCSQAELQMALTGGGVFVANGKKFVQQPACLPPASKSAYRIGFRVVDVDSVTLTVQVRGSNGVSCCATPTDGERVVDLDATPRATETAPVSRTAAVAPADFVHVRSDEQLFCLQEESFESNETSFAFEMRPLPASARQLLFQASATGDVHVVLAPRRRAAAAAYHLVIGGLGNLYSWISTSPDGLSEIQTKVATPKLLRQDRLQTFWISWDVKKLARKKRNNNGAATSAPPAASSAWSDVEERVWLSFGKGPHVGVRPVLMMPLPLEATPIRFVGLATGYGSAGFFRLWGTSDAVQQTSRTLSVASGAAADADAAADPTLNAEITVRGGTSASLDGLWNWPSGPLYASSASLTGLLEAFYVDRLKRSTAVHDDLNRLTQDLLRFRRPQDGAFHDGDQLPDLRLTALTLHALSCIGAQSYVDPTLIGSGLAWLHGVQDEDGGFTDAPASSTAAAAADRTQRLLTTAFVLSALADIQNDDIVLYQVTSGAQRFLEQRLDNVSDVDVLVPAAAAVLTSHSDSHWPPLLDQLDAVFHQVVQRYVDHSPAGLNALSCALAAYFHQNRPARYLAIVKQLVAAPWRSLPPLDRIRAMKMWDKYGKFLSDPVRNLNVRLVFQYGNVTESQRDEPRNNDVAALEEATDAVMAPLEAEYDQQPTAANETLAPAAAAALVKAPALEEVQHVRLHTPPLTYEIAHAPQNVHFSAAGTGCAVLNTRVVWRTAQPPPPPPPPASSKMAVYAAVRGSAGVKDEIPTNLTIDICIQWNGTDGVDLRAELESFSSFGVDSVAADDDDAAPLPYDARANHVLVYLNQMKSECARCFQVKTRRAGLVRRPQPARLRVYRKDGADSDASHWLLSGPPDWSTLARQATVPLTAAEGQLTDRPAVCHV